MFDWKGMFPPILGVGGGACLVPLKAFRLESGLGLSDVPPAQSHEGCFKGILNQFFFFQSKIFQRTSRTQYAIHDMLAGDL